VIEYFEEVTGRFLHPISVGQHENPAFIEQILRGVKHQLQKTLLEEVTTYRNVRIKHFADHHAERNRTKVESAYRGLLKDHPALQGHLVMDEDTIQLVDIACPV